MRRLASTVGLRGALCRFVASPVVLKNVPPAKSSSKIGIVVSQDDIAKAFQLPADILHKSYKPTEIIFVQMELARSRFAPLIASLAVDDDLTQVAAAVQKKNNKNNENNNKTKSGDALQPVAGAKEKFKSHAWSSLRELVTFYEEVMYPARQKFAEYNLHELHSYHARDDLKRGLAAFKQDHLDKQKAELTKFQKSMQECQQFIKSLGASCVDTAIMNDVANILRIAGEHNPFAHRMSMQVLEDMNLLGVAYDAMTKKLLHAITFDDGPFDDSALLFTVVEYPERGCVSVSKDSLNKIADDALNVMSGRHQIPLDEGKMMRQNDTYPCLPYSPE